MLQLLPSVRGTGRGDYAGEAMHGMGEGDEVDLRWAGLAPEDNRTNTKEMMKRRKGFPTVLNAYTATTLSQGVPSLGEKSSLLAMDRARWSVRWRTSLAVNDLPVKPQVYGLRDS
jgi:hypothetical protein